MHATTSKEWEVNSSLSNSQLSYRLGNVSEGAFRLLVRWLYSQDIQLIQLRDDEVKEDDTTNNENMCLVQLWIFAESLKLPKLQNLIIDTLECIGGKHAFVPDNVIPYVYKNTKPGSALREYFIDCCTFIIDRSAFQKAPQNFPKEMLLELADRTISLLEDEGYKHKKKDFGWANIKLEKYYVSVEVGENTLLSQSVSKRLNELTDNL